MMIRMLPIVSAAGVKLNSISAEKIISFLDDFIAGSNNIKRKSGIKREADELRVTSGIYCFVAFIKISDVPVLGRLDFHAD